MKRACANILMDFVSTAFWLFGGQQSPAMTVTAHSMQGENGSSSVQPPKTNSLLSWAASSPHSLTVCTILSRFGNT